MITESYTGTNCSGTNGGTSRILTLANTNLTVDGGLIVIVSNATLHPTTDFTISHLSSGSTITFLNAMFNDQVITIHYQTSIATSTASAGLIPLNGQLLNNEIAKFGSTITLRQVTDASYSDYGDATETTSDSSVKARINILNQEDELVKEGTFQTGDKVFWFQATQSGISRGNRIQHNSTWYEINQVIPYEIGDITYLLEARTKKI